MSSRICGPLGSEFLNANDFEKFFTIRESKYINKNFEVREKQKIGCGSNGCKTNLFFGFFFDGTRNDYIIAEKEISAKGVVVSSRVKIFQVLLKFKRRLVPGNRGTLILIASIPIAIIFKYIKFK
ncbi:hypothetical protein CNX70_13880 [Janthinobacterium svalbardensis]|uniref:Uncharacterized protein n=1 Tax=Janthinobacterium svalbardensis TaxID=368607 RepID=A0A290WW79_9BURK|nr:hypothetical protein [Janthinobacterium svalbardensis]ATD61132.1 hypothetical protein CNX70_13880 [Janthinobacterium svalbardensis]